MKPQICSRYGTGGTASLVVVVVVVMSSGRDRN